MLLIQKNNDNLIQLFWLLKAEAQAEAHRERFGLVRIERTVEHCSNALQYS